MRLLKAITNESAASIKQKMKQAANIADYKRWQIIYCLLNYDNVNAEYLADITGYSQATVYSIVQKFNKANDSIISKSRGGRRRSLMTLSEEQEILHGLEKQAINGQIMSFWDIKKVVEDKVGKPVSDDCLWDLFKRNNWTKHSPRPYHPKKDEAKQKEFKKNSKRIWMPQATTLIQD